MISNLHTHTVRCGHAKDEDEQYILRAIEGGFERLGFSDHAPFVFPDGYQSDFRVPIEKAKDYFDSLNGLRKKYKDKIEIFIGFEMEYYPKYFHDMLNNVTALGAEYLILGNHFINNEHPDGIPSVINHTDESQLKEYVDCVVSAMDSGCFTYIAHPDMFGFDVHTKAYEREMGRLCEHAVQTDTPLEFNLLGIRMSRHYPNPDFWKIASEVGGVKAVLGSDAHTAKDVFDSESILKAEKLLSGLDIELIEKPQIRFLRNI